MPAVDKGLGALLRHFIGRAGRNPSVTGRDGRWATHIAEEAIRRAQRKHRTVTGRTGGTFPRTPVPVQPHTPDHTKAGIPEHPPQEKHPHKQAPRKAFSPVLRALFTSIKNRAPINLQKAFSYVLPVLPVLHVLPGLYPRLHLLRNTFSSWFPQREEALRRAGGGQGEAWDKQKIPGN